jgi:antibiotic biosynthesis monooxygenase (ABM) superfamily enzyme
MNRRTSLKALAAAAAAGTPTLSEAAANPIQLHVDLEVDMAKEKDLLANFRNTFKPTIGKQPGFVEVKLMKFRKAMLGSGPGSWNYRLLISFHTEEQRMTWVASDDHQRAWPTIEKCLKGAKAAAWLYDLA